MQTVFPDHQIDYLLERETLAGDPPLAPFIQYGDSTTWVGSQHGLGAPGNLFLKRLLDILFSVALGIFFLPIILLTALLVWLDSPGPVIYKQERIGKHGRKIIIFKFRSMEINADTILAEHLEKNPVERMEWNQTQKLRDDPRITRVGKWIREYSVDELPQLLNVLIGDMSLVGPRPILVGQKKIYGDSLGIYQSVRPGLTGFWQISGRNRTTFQQRVLCDLYYVHNWSIWLDFYILLRTGWVVLSRDGAY